MMGRNSLAVSLQPQFSLFIFQYFFGFNPQIILVTLTMEGETTSHGSKEEQNSFEKIGTAPRGSETTISQEVAPPYKNNSPTDIERGNEALYKLNRTSSTDSPPKRLPAEELASSSDEDLPPSRLTLLWRRYRPFGHAIIWLLVTAYIYNKPSNLIM